MRFFLVLGLGSLFVFLALGQAQNPSPRSAKQALQAFNDLIGTWKGTGTPAGTREEQNKGFWMETIAFEWQFKGDDAWIKVDFDKSKQFRRGELRYLSNRDIFALTLIGPAEEKVTYTGVLKE